MGGHCGTVAYQRLVVIFVLGCLGHRRELSNCLAPMLATRQDLLNAAATIVKPTTLENWQALYYQ